MKPRTGSVWLGMPITSSKRHCARVSDRFDDITATSECPICGNAGHLRPHIVWVGEAPIGMDLLHQALPGCRLLLAVGAAVTAEPIAGCIGEARRAGARTVELNPQPASGDTPFDERIAGPLGRTVPGYVKALIGQGADRNG